MSDSFLSLKLHILFHQVLLTSSPKYIWIWGSPPFLCKATNYSTTLCHLGWSWPPNWSKQFYSWFFPLYSLSGSHSHPFKLQTRLCHHLLEPLKAFNYTLYYVSQGPMWFLPIDLWTLSSPQGLAGPFECLCNGCKSRCYFLSQQKQFNYCLLMPAYFVQLFTLWPFWALRYSISGLVSFKIFLDTGICILLLPFIGFPWLHSVLRPTPMLWSLGKRDSQSPQLLDCRASPLPLSYFTCVPSWHTGFSFESGSVLSSRL